MKFKNYSASLPNAFGRSHFRVGTDEKGCRCQKYYHERIAVLRSFPGEPIMPGVLLIEAMAQVGGVAMLYPEENRGKIAVFGKIDNVRFRRQVVPGIRLLLQLKL